MGQRDMARVEDETQSDLTGVYYYGLPPELSGKNDELVTLSAGEPPHSLRKATQEAKVSFNPQRIRTSRLYPSPR